MSGFFSFQFFLFLAHMQNMPVQVNNPQYTEYDVLSKTLYPTALMSCGFRVTTRAVSSLRPRDHCQVPRMTSGA